MSEIASFHEVRFPTDIAFGSSGGPQRRTEIISFGSGHEQRNARWVDSRRRYDAGYGIKNLNDLHAIIAFYEERRGPLHGFRFRDHIDWKSCAPNEVPTFDDQVLGVADGSQSVFQLSKRYGEVETGYSRSITKPVAGSVSVAVDGVVRIEGDDFTLDPTTGLLTLTQAPTTGSIVTAGFLFDVPVRFESDQLTINVAAFQAGELPSVSLVEIKV